MPAKFTVEYYPEKINELTTALAITLLGMCDGTPRLLLNMPTFGINGADFKLFPGPLRDKIITEVTPLAVVAMKFFEPIARDILTRHLQVVLPESVLAETVDAHLIQLGIIHPKPDKT